MTGRRSFRVSLLLLNFVGAAFGLEGGQRARAAEHPSIAGEYVCTALCRPSDAPPSIAVTGDIASCMSELGGIDTGRLLSDTSVSCFRKTGTLAADGKTLHWSDGVVWERRSPHAD